MTLLKKLSVIAEWLAVEAHRRARRAGRVRDNPGYVFIPRAGKGKAFCTISLFQFKNYVVVAFKPLPGKKMIVYCQRAKRKRKARGKSNEREWRKGFRKLYHTQKFSTHVMVIDDKTPRREIVEQLAIFFLRNKVSDVSLDKLFRSEVLSRALLDFVDPPNSRSYPAYKKKVRQDILPTEKALLGEELWDSAPAELDRNHLGREEIEKRQRQLQKQGEELAPPEEEQEEYFVSRAARMLDIHRRSLYKWIEAGKVRTGKGKMGRLVINREDLEKIRCQVQDQTKEGELRQILTRFLANRRGVEPQSARKHVYRKIKQGKTIRQIFDEEAGKLNEPR